MTISSSTRTVAFTGNGLASVFAFAFKVFAATDLMVVVADTSGNQTTKILNTDYSVSLNADQNGSPGGSITLTAGALATGYTLVITTNVPNTQGTDLSNGGGFYPEVITTALDRLTVLVQQLQAQLNRALLIPIADPSTVSGSLPPATTRAGMFLTFDANGNPQTSISATIPPGVGIGYLETIATVAQTVFATPAYIPGTNSLLVTLGGMLLTNGLDYTETNAGTITLTQGAAAGDVLTFRVIH